MRIHIKIFKFCLLPLVCSMRLISYLIPRNKNRIVIGAWLGDLYCDSSKYFAEYILKNSRLQVCWIGKKNMKDALPTKYGERLKFIEKDTLEGFYYLLTSKTWVSCQGSWADLTSLPLYGGALIVNLWHGIPLKLIGRLSPKNKNRRANAFEKVSNLLKRFANGSASEWVSISSKHAGEIMVGSEPEHYSYGRLLPWGLVRNDFLINNRENDILIESMRQKYSRLLRFDKNKKIVLYLPTFRKPGCRVFSFYRLPQKDQVRIKAILDDNNAVLIEKHHYLTYRDYPVDMPSQCSVVVPADMQGEIDVQELYLATDIMVGDYSSGIIDYGLLKRPAIHFVYDLEEYATTDSGLAYDLKDVAVGPFVKTLGDLESVLTDLLKEPKFTPAPRYHELVEYEKGNAGENILKFMNEKLGL